MISLIADTRAKRYVLHAACDSVTHLIINGKRKAVKKCVAFFMNSKKVLEGMNLASPKQTMKVILLRKSLISKMPGAPEDANVLLTRLVITRKGKYN